MFVAFYTGFIEEEGYGSQRYFQARVEYGRKDQYCAERNVFYL